MCGKALAPNAISSHAKECGNDTQQQAYTAKAPAPGQYVIVHAYRYEYTCCELTSEQVGCDRKEVVQKGRLLCFGNRMVSVDVMIWIVVTNTTAGHLNLYPLHFLSLCCVGRRAQHQRTCTSVALGLSCQPLHCQRQYAYFFNCYSTYMGGQSHIKHVH